MKRRNAASSNKTATNPVVIVDYCILLGKSDHLKTRSVPIFWEINSHVLPSFSISNSTVEK